MNIPGFTAEASLNRPMEFYPTSPIGSQIQRARVLPQAPVSLTFETTGCNFQICTWTIYDERPPRPPTFSCTAPVNICAHPNAGASL
jgi:hypothetical protein